MFNILTAIPNTFIKVQWFITMFLKVQITILKYKVFIEYVDKILFKKL